MMRIGTGLPGPFWVSWSVKPRSLFGALFLLMMFGLFIVVTVVMLVVNPALLLTYPLLIVLWLVIRHLRRRHRLIAATVAEAKAEPGNRQLQKDINDTSDATEAYLEMLKKHPLR